MDIGSAPPTELLALMSIPCISAIFLAAFIGFALHRRAKKSKASFSTQTEPSVLSTSVSPNSPKIDKASVQRSSVSSTQSSNPPASSPRNPLDLATLSKAVDSESVTSEPNYNEKIDLAARLGHNTPVEQEISLQNSSEAVELLRLLKDSDTDQLIVEVAGHRYTKLADITNKEIGQYILKLVAHLLSFTNGVIVTQTGTRSLQVPKVGNLPKPIRNNQTEAPASALKSSSASSSSTETGLESSQIHTNIQQSALSQPLQLTSPVQEEPIRKRSGFFGLGAVQQAPKQTVPTLNLADEINDIVQDRLRISPLDATTEIVVTSDLGGGIRIKVNNQSYTSPDDIPDDRIRDLIKASIKEWERR